METRVLKKELTKIRDNDWVIGADIDITNLAFGAMTNIGSTDAELRDDLILSFLYVLITERHLSEDDIRRLLDICLCEDHLFYKLGEEGDDSVFNRSFTVLIIRWIIHYDNEYGGLLSKNEMMRVFESVISYVRLEKDMRGFDSGHGWAHSLAHAATALRTLALSEYIGKKELLELLEVVKEKASIDYHVYITDESERMVMVVVNIMSRKLLSHDEIMQWISSFEKLDKPENIVNHIYQRENMLGFLRALYFRLRFKKASDNIIDAIERVANDLNEFHNNMKK